MYFHCSPKRFRVGDILRDELIPSFNYTKPGAGVFMTKEFGVHETIAGTAISGRWFIYQVDPLGPGRRGYKGEFISRRAEIIKLLGRLPANIPIIGLAKPLKASVRSNKPKYVLLCLNSPSVYGGGYGMSKQISIDFLDLKTVIQHRKKSDILLLKGFRDLNSAQDRANKFQYWFLFERQGDALICIRRYGDV